MTGFDTLQVGASATRTFSFTKEAVHTFADLVNDHAPVHVDKGFAHAQGFSDRIVHGLFLAAIFSGMLGEELPGPYSVINMISVKVHRPVFIGEQITYRIAVKQCSEAVRAVVLELRADNAQNEQVLSGTAACSFTGGNTTV